MTEPSTAYFDAWHGGVIDTMIGMPASHEERKTTHYAQMNAGILDKEAREHFSFPAQYMFKDVPDYGDVDDPVALLLAEMDRFNITRGMINVGTNPVAQQAAAEHPDRFIASFNVDPNRGMECVRELETAVQELGVRSAQAFPAGLLPQVPINDKKFYPIYAKCVELDIPIFVNAGVPGPRVPMACQDVAHIDEVCWFFPALKFVMRHGAEPWTGLAAKLMRKWPNLYYSTSGFAPKHLPADIIHFANTRGADKIIYAGYFPMGLSLERIFSELPGVAFRDHVWPKFLRENAARILGVSEASDGAPPARGRRARPDRPGPRGREGE